MKLAWRNRYQHGEVDCKMCGAVVETLEHFILECSGYEDVRQEFGVREMEIKELLGFEREGDIEKSKRFLKKIWLRREGRIRQGNG